MWYVFDNGEKFREDRLFYLIWATDYLDAIIKLREHLSKSYSASILIEEYERSRLLYILDDTTQVYEF